MSWIKNLLAKIAGKKIGKEMDKMEETTKKWYASKTIWAGVVTVLIAAYNAGSTTFGWPVVPDWIFTLLGAIGIYSRVDAKKAIA
jgi:hypothetical protein